MDRGPTSDPYKRLFETMLDGAIVLDAATTHIVLANKAAARIFGFASPEDMVGTSPLDYVPKEEQEQVIRMMAESFERDRETPAEIRIFTRDKRTVWVSASGTLIEHEGKKATFTTIRDITSEKAKDAALREAEHRYENLFDGMLDGAVVLDLSTFQIAYANKAAAEMFGFSSPREVVGENPLSYIPEEDRDEVARMIALSLEGKGQNPAEIRVITRDKRNLWVSANATAIDYEGRTSTLTTLRDITADKAKDAALRAAEESKLRLVDAAAESIFIVQGGKMVYVNPAGARVAGVSQQQMIGLPFLDFVHPDERQAVMERYGKLMKGQFFTGHTTVKGIDASGQTRWAEIREIPYSWQGRPAVMSLVVDVTDRVRLEEERREKEERFRSIIENAWDGITILDENYSVIFESPSLGRITGYTPEEWMGRPVGQMAIHPDDLAPLLAKMETLKSQPDSVIRDFIVRYQHKDGSWRWIEATGHNLLYDPRVKGLVVNFRDVTERMKAEEEMRGSQEHFRTLIEKATDVVIVLDATGKITYQSPSLERVTGYGPNEWVNRSLDELLVHPDDLLSLASLLERVLTQPGATVEGVTARYQHKDGSWHTLEATVTNMLHDPKVNGIVANFRDITDRKAALEALSESEQKFRLLVENSTDLIFSLDTQGNFSYVSPAIERISGYCVDEVIGTSFVRFVVPEDLPGLMASFERTLAGVTEPSEFRAVLKDGAIRHVQTTSRVVMRDGEVVGLTGIMSDITERKKAEAALRASEERNRLLVENVNEAITVVQDTVLRFVNPKFAQLTGYPEKDLVGKPFVELVHPDDREMLAGYYARRLKGKEAPQVYQFKFIDKAGNTRWAEINAVLFEWEGRPATLGLLNDVTQRREAEQTLREAKEYAENVIRTANVLVVVLDAEGNVTLLNEAGEKITGYQQNDVLGKNWFELIVPKERYPHVWEEFNKLKAAGTIIDTFENPILTKSGEERIVSWKNSTLVINNKVVGTLSFGTDVTERKRAEEALRGSEEKYKRLFESTQTAMEVISMETGLVVLANKATARMFGFASPDDLVGIDSMQFLRPEDREFVANGMARAVADKTWQEIAELQVRTNDGRWLWISGMAVQSEYQGKPALLISLLNITSRKEAEEKIRESEEKYRLLTEKTNDVIWTTDLNLHTTYVSPSVERLLGFTPEERLKHDVTDQMPPESLARAQVALLEHLALERDPKADPNRTLRIELEYYRKDGSTVWLENQVSGIRDANGTLIGLHGVARDISERRKVEQALRDSEAIYKGLFENTQTAMEVINAETGLVILANETTARMFGFASADDLVGVDSMEYLLPEDRDRVATQMAQALANKDRTGATEMSVRTKDGRWLWINALVTYTEYRGKTAMLISLIDLTSRKRAEETLGESEQKYRLLTEKTNDLIWTADLNLHTTYVSPSVERILGFTVEERLRQDATQQMTPESSTRAAEALAEHLALERDPNADPLRTLRVELEYYRKDGSTVWLENQVSGIRDEKGVLIALHGVARDISERRKVEQALKVSEERYRLLAENASDIIWVTDADLKITYASPSATSLLGYSLEDITARSFDKLLTPDSLAHMTQVYKDDMAAEESAPGSLGKRTVEIEVVCKDGSTLWLEAAVSAVRDGEGQFAGFQGACRNITERRRAQEAISESEKKFRLLFNSASDAIFIHDLTGQFLEVNEIACQRLGYTREELLCLTPTDLDSPEYAKQVADRIGQVVRDGQAIFETAHRTKDGRLIPIEANARIVDFGGKPAVLVIGRDMTERKKAQEALLASETKYRNLFEHTLLGMEVIDGETGKVVLANHSVARMFGFKSPEDMVGTNPMDYVPPEDLEWVTNQLAQVLADPEKRDVATLRAKTEEGRTIWVTASGTSFEYEGKLSMLLSLIDVTTAKEAEDQLQESEEKNRLLIDNAAEGIAVVQDGIIKFTNRRFAESVGYSAQELVSRSFVDLLHPDDRQRVAEYYIKRVGGEAAPSTYQFRWIDREAAVHWGEASVVVLRWEDRPAVLCMLSDITERVKAEQAVRESEERFRALVERASDAIAVLDASGKVTYYSPSMERATGYGPGEWVDKSLSDLLVHPDDLPALASHLERILKEPGATVEGITTRYRHRDGTWHVLEATVRNLLSDPKVNGIVANFRDVTERIKAEESLRNSEERFRGLVETSSDWVWEMDRHNQYTYVSPKVRDILGYEPQELLGHTPYEFMHQREGRRVSKIVRRFADAHLPFSLLENTCAHKDGHSVVLETSAVPILGSDGSHLGYRGIDRDITERKKVEQELQRSLKRLEKTMESTIEAITTTIETRDPYTTGHQMRVTDLACAIARVMELPPTQIEGIRVAGLLHDIGKIAIPTEILSKPGKLNEVEFSMIQTHPKVGYNILKKIEFAWPVAKAVLQHHERWNGSGYPDGLRGEDILLESRILAVADVMEAMASHRPYRPALGLDKALDEIAKNGGTLYDPAVAKACVTAFTQGGFKFGTSIPGVVTDSGGTSSDRPVHSPEDHRSGSLDH